MLCKAKDCKRKSIAKEYCDLHYRRFLKYGKPDTIRRPMGTGCLNKYGYIVIPNPRGGQMAQHRKIMEDYIGRILLPYETVHHLNGIKHDNRIENLELWDKRHPSGQRLEDKIQWAKMILEENGYNITH